MSDSIFALFPTPVFKTKISSLTEEHKKILFSEEVDMKQQVSNIRSKDIHILNRPCFSSLKKEVEKHLETYVKQIICPQKDIELVITNSWFIVTKPGQKHHIHHHPNSYISGVIYIQTLKEDYLKFIRDGEEYIQIFASSYNPFNCRTWNLEVQEKDLLIFPSSLRHCVDTNSQDTDRSTIAFNTWIKGTIGCDTVVSSLNL